jgi:peptidoglycan/LPS O-acetylase OafA/YrhL
MNSQHGLFAAYVLTPCRLDGLLLGAWLALAMLDDNTWRKVKKTAPYVATVAALGIAVIAANRGHFYDFIPPGVPHDSRMIVTVGIALVSLLFAAVLTIVLDSSWLAGWLELPLLRRIGLYSYGMYVYHMCIIVFLQQANLLNGISEARSKLLLFLIVTAFTFMVAALSYHGLEKPFLKLKPPYATRQVLEQPAEAHAPLQSMSDFPHLKNNITLPETPLALLHLT